MTLTELIRAIKPFVLSWITTSSPVPSVLGDHDHTGDSGDGGKLKVNALNSDTADLGDVPISNGSGIVTWGPVVATSIDDHAHIGFAGDGGKIAGTTALSDTSTDTYNESVAKILKGGADGGIRLDHLELGNVTGASEGELRMSGQGTSAAPALTIGSGTDTGFYQPYADWLAASAGGTPATATNPDAFLTYRFLQLGTGLTLDIDADGAIAPVSSRQLVETRNLNATDDLVTISGGVDGALLILSSVNTNRVVTVKNGTDNIFLGSGDCVLDDPMDTLTLIHLSGNWLEIARSNNG